MMTKVMFSSEVELGKFLGSINVISEAYQAISKTNSNSVYKLHTTPSDTTPSGINILAFNCSHDTVPKKDQNYSPDDTTIFLDGEFSLVASKKSVEFIPTKVDSSVSNPTKDNSSFSIELFQQLSDGLKEEENKHINTPLIITGSGLGGYLAILSTLRLHNAIDVEESKGSKKTKRPICITFGSFLFGDAAFQSAINERPQWKSSFLNVVAKNDPVVGFYSSDTPYKPFGTFLFCTESGGHAAFEDQDSILQVLEAMKPSNAGNVQVYDYTKVLELIQRKKLYRGASELGKSDLSLLRAGITLQFREVNVLNDISNDQIGKMEKQKIEIIRKKNLTSAYDPTKKLNDMKLSLTNMEWYMKDRKHFGGYYDSYKNAKSRDEVVSHQQIVRNHRVLNQYWKKFVEDKDRMPQKEGAKLRKRWLLGGNNYRRIVEPLDIAEHYKNGKTNYIKDRSDHYKLLEKWLDEHKKEELESSKDKKESQSGEDKKELQSSEEKRNKAASLTEDSCFWAHVEEALISLRNLVNLGSINVEKEPEKELKKLELQKELEKFEGYVMKEIQNYAVSPEIFLKGSSLMTWWNEYKAYKGTEYASEFAEYMNKAKYNSYK